MFLVSLFYWDFDRHKQTGGFQNMVPRPAMIAWSATLEIQDIGTHMKVEDRNPRIMNDIQLILMQSKVWEPLE